MTALVGAVTTGHALTLGDLRGGAVVGRSLDVSVPVVASAGEQVLPTCLSAEVLFGDQRQLTTNLSLKPVNAELVSMTMVRIRSGAAVNEPVVTVTLTSTCGSTLTRRYVLLTDFPTPDLPRIELSPVDARSLPQLSEVQSNAVKQIASNGSARAPLANAAAALQESGIVQNQAASQRPMLPKATAPAKKRPKPTSQVAKSTPRPAPSPLVKSTPEKPVLKLDQSLVLPAQAEPLATAPELPASSAASDEAVQQAMRIEALQNDIKALKDLAQKNQASLAEFQSKLRQAEDERVPLIWFYLLAGLLAVTLATLTWVLRKQQAVKKIDEAWWQQVMSDPTENVADSPSPTLEPIQSSAEVAQRYSRLEPVLPVVDQGVELADSLPQTEIDLDIDLDSLSPSDQPALAHGLNVDNVSDIRQQAEFFVSLGQIERALDVLRKQMTDSIQPSPLVYLDLLTLYHSQGMKTDFRELRTEFGPFFNVVVPDFAAFNLPANDLSDYPETLDVLVRFWPKVEAIAFLEACIFHNNATPMQLSFDVPAFRDLLMLHELAESVTSDEAWKLTQLSGLAEQVTSPAEWAGLAIDIDMQTKKSTN